MATSRFSPLAGAAFLALTALLAACGGGGGGGGTSGGGGGGGVPPTLSPSNPPPTNPPATPTPASSGQMTTAAGNMANATVAFTCGCTQQAGQVNADANGAYNITVPAAMFGGGAGTYTPPGHNLMVIGYGAGAGSHLQSWTMEFFGNTPANDQNLDGTASANVSDKYTTAAALYVYYQTIQYYIAHPPANNDNTYDVWNFNDIKAFKAKLASNPTQAETNLINGVVSAQASNTSLYPAVPSWDHSSGDTQNNTIVNLIKAMITADGATLPQPCGASCTGTPSP